MTFYCGIDLHSKKSHVCIIDKHGKKVKEEKLNNDLSIILQFLKPFGKDVHIAIESTINWYWIVDGLQEAGYDVKLAHTLGLHMITGAKVKTDRRDAFKLAKLLRMGEIPEAYIYPKEKRPLRDLLRRRAGLVQERAACYSSLRVQFIRYNLNTMSLTDLKQFLPADIYVMPIPQELKDYCVMILKDFKNLYNINFGVKCSSAGLLSRRNNPQSYAQKHQFLISFQFPFKQTKRDRSWAFLSISITHRQRLAGCSIRVEILVSRINVARRSIIQTRVTCYTALYVTKPTFSNVFS